MLVWSSHVQKLRWLESRWELSDTDILKGVAGAGQLLVQLRGAGDKSSKGRREMAWIKLTENRNRGVGAQHRCAPPDLEVAVGPFGGHCGLARPTQGTV